MEATVIIPTVNRSKTLEKALDSIVKQTLSQDFFEVIVVDNGSTDGTKKIVESFTDKIKNLVYIYDATPGLHIGRHRGLEAAQSNILIYGDDDIEALPTWLDAILASFQDERVALVGGKNLPNFEAPPPAWIKKMWESGGDEKILDYLSIIDLGDEIKKINPFYVFGCNFSIRREVLLEAGGFHPDGMPQELIKYRGDGESSVSKYIKDRGYTAIYNPKASVYHLCSKKRMTIEYFTKRAFSQGVSDSYTAIREDIEIKDCFKRKVKFIIKKYILQRDMGIEENYIRGFDFHQNEMNKDKELMAWIKRKTYINNGGIK